MEADYKLSEAGSQAEDFLKVKRSVTGELKDQCVCGNWKPIHFKECWDCWSKQPSKVLRSFK